LKICIGVSVGVGISIGVGICCIGVCIRRACVGGCRF
jgi:hypothetical protein